MLDPFTGTLGGIWDPHYFGFFSMLVVLMCLLSVLLYGVYIVLFMYSAYALRRHGSFANKSSRMALFCVTCLIFAMVTGYNLINLIFTLLGLRHITIVPPPDGSSDLGLARIDARLPIEGTNLASVRTAFAGWTFIFGDGIIVWRALALWASCRKVIIIPGFFLLGSVVTTVVSFGFDINPLNVSSTAINDISIASWCFSLATSFTSTLLIAYKAWEFDVFSKKDTVMEEERNGVTLPSRSQAARVLTLIIESGFLYCVVWITIIFTEFITMPILNKETHGVILTIPIGVQLAGIYPTIIIILVSHHQSLADSMQGSLSRQSGLIFASYSERKRALEVRVESADDAQFTGTRSSDKSANSGIRFAPVKSRPQFSIEREVPGFY